MKPRLPKNVSPIARKCLENIAARGLGKWISIGGAFGLAHYYEYRPTHVLDAWWREPVGQETRENAIAAIREALEDFGNVNVRAWSDVTSVELTQNNKTVFSFQIAHRSTQLDEPVEGPWPGEIRIDSFRDLLASKMVALIERGAPRDFGDIHAICSAGLSSREQCWELWAERQERARENADALRARTAIRTHLSRIALARPLDKIADEPQRGEAAGLRAWFEGEFLGEHAN